MKTIIYKNPVLSAISINIFSLIIFIYSIKERNTLVIMLLIFVGIGNRKIIDNGINLNKHKKVIINISFFLMIIIGLMYNYYMHEVLENQIINRL